AVEEKICALYPEQQMRCPVHISIGQEATAVGTCAALCSEDMVFSNHRSHGHYLAKGGDLKKFFAELYGKISGCSKGRGGSMHLIDLDVNFMGSTPIVGNIIPVAVGAAFSLQLQQKSQVVVVFIGDGAIEEGVFHESLNFAKLKGLPILFFCENNLYSVYTPLNKRQPDRKISNIPKGHGLLCYEIDGNNVETIYKVVSEAVALLREGKGPIFIEAYTYRWREHCGPNYDNHIGYRTEEEFLKWKQLDPLEICRQQVLQQGLITTETLTEFKKKIEFKISEAVKFAQESNFPDQEQLDKFVYAP
ncbi:thiamine pyrophosphate-dependent dehydrogenase E1 component subunit alpha, partial [Candidatus Woesearchaeota archaeon]|nr:thiamine pyrophosphate-dependent dehydrogenase E1 component subunit alpha [Candidatus Woesearchaeota archaeon]